ncbi:hypothetical protein ACFSJU_16375 [Paradesertivirga mongoliensis]|uniref:Uncharacterized protein n=1 Tax=Paradesertivirga mongoliensis TaxID=2100740 RepID=A0ABW4ZQB1_9SPHI|nr:hypothetical protein [Pedobacter mongoliensis]
MLASAIPEMLTYIQTTSAKHKLIIRRQRSICTQTAVLIRYIDQLYLEWRYCGPPVLARALILLLQLVQQLNALLPATCQKVLLPRALLDRARRRYRKSCDHLHMGLAVQGVSAELIELALLPLHQLMKNEPMAYKRFEYIMQHLRLLNKLVLTAESSEQVDDILCQKLIAVNYNNLQFIDFCVSEWKSALGNIRQSRMQRRFIRMQKKNLLALETEAAFIYDSRFVPAKTALLRWLLEEQKALKKEIC